MDTRLLKYFLAIVEAGSISHAATRLHMTQPPLSAALAQLERDLGVTLFVRTGRGVVPTAAGDALYRYAFDLMEGMGDIRDQLQRMHTGAIGHLRLAVVAPFLWGPLPDLLRQTLKVAPDLDVSVSSPAPLEVCDLVRRGHVEVGVVSITECSEMAERYAYEFRIARAGFTTLVAVLPPRFASSTAPIDLADLNGETWIMARSTLSVASVPEMVRDAWSEHHIRPVRERTVESVMTAMPLIAADLGVSLLPEPAMAQGGAVVRQLAQELPPLEFAVLWDKERELSAVARRFLSIALD